MRLGRAWFAAPLLAAALLVAAAGPVSAAGGGEAPLVASSEMSGSLGPEAEQTGEQFRLVAARPWAVLPSFGRPVSEASKSGSGTVATRRSPTDQSLLAASTAQSDTEISPDSDTERRLVGRESSERVDAVVIALWSIAAGMTVMLVLFLWHTSPRRRLRLARRRSTQLYDGEADLVGAAVEAGSGDAGVVDDAAAAMQDAEAVAVAAAGADEDLPPSGAALAMQDAEAVAVAAAGAGEDLSPSGAALAAAWEEPAAAGSADEDETEPETEPVEDESGPAGPVVSTAWEESEVEEPELPPVWEDGAAEPGLQPAREDEAEPIGEEAEPAGGSPANEPQAGGAAAGGGRPGFWMQLRRTLGLD